MEEISVGTMVGAAAFVAGIVFGATAQSANFCTMGALSDIVFMDDWRRFRAWMLAIAVAVLGSQGLAGSGLVNLDGAIYLTPRLGWAGAILGGLMFGYGMTRAGGCGNKTLVRLGGGNLKSLVVMLVMGVFAYMTLRGLLAQPRTLLEGATTVTLPGAQGIDALLAAATGMSRAASRWAVTAVVSGGLLVFCFKDAIFRASGRDIAAGLIIGLMVPVGWAITGILGFDDFSPTPLASFSFVAPTADGLQYVMTFTGATLNFGIAAVGGVVVGAFLAALASRSFHLEAFVDAPDMLNHIGGAALMGVGGVLALGCTIGQGITGVSTLAVGSVIALLSIFAGGLLGLKSLEEGSLAGAFKALMPGQG